MRKIAFCFHRNYVERQKVFVEHHTCINSESATMLNDALCTPPTLAKCERS